MWTFIVALVSLTAGLRAQDYDSDLGQTLIRICPENQAVSRVKSSHSSIENDRRWTIECKAFQASHKCSWSGYHDLHDREFSYNCPANQAIVGVISKYDDSHGDRRWNFLCCSVENLITFECRETPMVNYWNEDFDWHVPGDNILTGVSAHQKSDKGDHRWSFSYCRGTTQDPDTVNSQILAANQPIEAHLTEGDVVVQTSRNAISCLNCRWPKPDKVVQVPYVISDAFSSIAKSKIDDAIDSFHLSTCVRFVPRRSQNNYINIVKGSGCWSYIGRIGGDQKLSLSDGCIQKGIIQHEIIHSLGFWHEQSRTDRDLYVKINYENIQDKRERNFEKRETNNLNIPYDYGSVMHYGAKAFSKNGEDTISPREPSAQIGQRHDMSENDILKINKLYGCDDYLHKHGNWDNELQKTLSRSCPSGQVVSGIRSVHNQDKNDRLWAISCKAFKSTNTCYWSSVVNSYKGDFSFQCPDNQVIAGAQSEHSTTSQDRRWRFLCCRAKDFAMFNCRETPVINYWQEYFNWAVPTSNYLTGLKSSFDENTRDRRWSFSYCQRKAQ